MTRPRKSIAELLAEREAAKAEAKPTEPIVETPDEPAPDPEPINIVIVPAATPAPTDMNANESASAEAKPRASRLSPRPYNPIPANQTCGARTRAGTPCQSRVLYRSGRCKNHGGLSTGPKSAEGKARVARNGTMPKRRKAKSMAATENFRSDLTKPDIGR